ncbi:hypothetical protein JCM9534A_18170 [Catenuloplanes indicus JCM 9534]
MAESHSVEPTQWRRTIDLVIDSFAGRFCRVEPRRAAAGFVTGLLADLEIKTCWQVAEQAGCDATVALPSQVGRRRGA